MLNGHLRAHYGLPAGVDAWQKTVLPAGQRSGLLTQGSLLAQLATATETHPIALGRFVRERLLCGHVPPPPNADLAVFPPENKQITQRQRVAQHSADPACAGCHLLMDPLGFPLESYDAIGRWQTTDNGFPVDTRGAIEALPGGRRSEVANAVELAKALSALPEARSCFAAHLGRYVTGHPSVMDNACMRSSLDEIFQSQGGQVLQSLVALLTTDDFFVRRRE